MEIDLELTEKSAKNTQRWWKLTAAIIRFTINSSTRIIEFRGFLNQFSTNFHEILHTLFAIYAV